MKTLKDLFYCLLLVWIKLVKAQRVFGEFQIKMIESVTERVSRNS